MCKRDGNCDSMEVFQVRHIFLSHKTFQFLILEGFLAMFEHLYVMSGVDLGIAP